MTMTVAARSSSVAKPVYEEIPSLDLGPYLAGEPGALDALAGKLARIQQEIGFYYITNHGVPQRLISQANAQLKRFFALPMDEKMKLKTNANSVGFIPPKSTIYVTSNVNTNTKPDLNECLITVRERPADHPSIVAKRRFHGPNQWPSESVLPGYREKMLEYYAAMEALGYKMLPVYARALGLPADYFTALFKDPQWTTRNQFYPVVPAEDNQFGISPHRDHGFLTLLPLAEEPGLQILTPGGKWLDAKVQENGIIVNTGEFMHRWSNGRFIATPHRVLPPKNPRYSIAFFFNPSWDTVCHPFPTCVGPDDPPRYEPMSMLDYICWYLDRNFAKSAGGQQDDAAIKRGLA